MSGLRAAGKACGAPSTYKHTHPLHLYLLAHSLTHIRTYQVVLRVNLKQDSDEFKEVKQALEEVVEQHRELVNPQRNWKTAAYQLASLAVLIGTLLHFTRHDMLSD